MPEKQLSDNVRSLQHLHLQVRMATCNYCRERVPLAVAMLHIQKGTLSSDLKTQNY
ncbi:MAG: hypothetical protein ACTSYD_06135 [Candidatus Heimdallarchaeaceae archaeon]